jgi:HEAT repeat protein
MKAASLALAATFLLISVARAELSEIGDDGWHTWQVAASGEAPDWCCHTRNRSNSYAAECNLDARQSAYVSHDDNDATESPMQIYVLLERDQVTMIRTYSAHCPVVANTTIVDLGRADAAESVRWLTDSLAANRKIATHALAAIAVHEGPAAVTALVDTATNDTELENRKDAVFWMGQVRAKETHAHIKRLMFSDENAEFREHAAFSLAQSDAPGRVDALVKLGSEDRNDDVRSRAWFWLAQTGESDIEAQIHKAIRSEADDDVREQAIFALSQLPVDRAAEALARVLEDRQLPDDDRKTALFWLAQLDSDSAMAYIDRLLSGN